VVLLKDNINSNNAEQLPVNQPKDRHCQSSGSKLSLKEDCSLNAFPKTLTERLLLPSFYKIFILKTNSWFQDSIKLGRMK
jgi:hypothetical protein